MQVIPGGRRVDPALAVLRFGVGLVIAAHGYQKLFEFGFAGVTKAFTQMGVPLPGITGPLIACLEFFGGIALIFGVLTSLFAFLLACDMLGAILMVKLRGGLVGPQGMELELLLMLGAVALVFSGAGAYSVDAAISQRASAARQT
jgi:putative oxidoreductase